MEGRRSGRPPDHHECQLDSPSPPPRTRHLTDRDWSVQFIDPSGHSNRRPARSRPLAVYMAHLDVKGRRIPTEAGGASTPNSAQKRAVDRAKTAAPRRFLYLHSIVGVLHWPTRPLERRRARPQRIPRRAKSGSPPNYPLPASSTRRRYRSNDFARIVGHRTRHQKTKPYTPRHNGKAERYQRIMTEELLYAREYASEDERSQAIAIWNVHYNYHRPHSAAGGQPPASRLKTRVTNVRPSYN